jgi:hypothetical protein
MRGTSHEGADGERIACGWPADEASVGETTGCSEHACRGSAYEKITRGKPTRETSAHRRLAHEKFDYRKPTCETPVSKQ